MPTMMETGTANLQSIFTDQFIAGELLNATKTAVTTTARAITEATSPSVKEAFRKQLDDAIMAHERVFNYMKEKGWYNPMDVNAQLQMDLQGAQQALNLPQ